MNLLVVGNGFDLAHGLPTRYSDFLDFMTLCIREWHDWRKWRIPWNDEPNPYKYYDLILTDIYDNISSNIQVSGLFSAYKEKIENLILNNEKLKSFHENIFLRYCLYSYAYNQTFSNDFKWIDIENEMLNFLNNLQKCEYHSTDLSHISFNLPYRERSGTTSTKPFYMPTVQKKLKGMNVPHNRIKATVFRCLFNELKEFSNLLKIYLKLTTEEFNKKHQCVYQINMHSPNSISIDHILSFNYTDFSQRYYAPNVDINFINGSLSDENIILGVENASIEHTGEYCDNNVSLFFKNYQRVLYDYQYVYNGWLHEKTIEDHAKKTSSNEAYDVETNVYIVGHSLSISDKYILTDVIMNADYVTIYYFCEQDKQDKILNLYKLLGDEVFSTHVNHTCAKPSIRFANQKEILMPSNE